MWDHNVNYLMLVAVADPGFPVEGSNLVGGTNTRRGYVSKKFYAEMKESGPLGVCQWGDKLTKEMWF